MFAPLPSAALAASEVPFAELVRISPAGSGPSVTAERVTSVTLDVERDGDLDVVTCLAQGAIAQLLWWENDGNNDGATSPRFRARSIGSLPGSPTGLVSVDLDRDGDRDVVAATASTGTLAWFENLGGSFAAHSILVAAEIQSLAAADLDGDGAPDLCAVDGALLVWLENDGLSPPSFVQRSVNSTSTCLEQVRVGDLDGDGDFDLLTTSACENRIDWQENNGATPLSFVEQTVTLTAQGVRDASLADVDLDGDLDFVTANAGEQEIEWYENLGGSFAAHTVASNLIGLLSVHTSDLDQDGDPDVACATNVQAVVRVYENQDLTFAPRSIRLANSSAERLFTDDLDADGDADVLVALKDGSTGWLRNVSLHQSAFLPTQHTVEAVLDEADEARPADLDGDGDLDVIAVSRAGNTVSWWENVDGLGRSWQAVVIDNAVTRAAACDAADLDGDGDLDVLGASFTLNDVLWWENVAGDGSAWQRRTIDAALVGAQAVASADVDGDGDLDVFANGETADDVTYYENLGRGRTWTKVTIDAAFDGANFVRALDIDGDGDFDVASAARNGDQLAWWENTDGAGQSWTKHTVALSYDLAAGLDLADVDGDGDIDVLGVSFNSNEITWFENLDRVGGSFAQRVIDNDFTFAIFVAGADLDQDGDLDVIGSAHNQGEISWFENLDGSGTSWLEHAITVGFDIVTSSLGADLDGDGDLDVLGAAAVEDKILWWENRGGEYATTTTSIAPPALQEGEQTAVLQIELAHRGRVGDRALRMTALAVLLEESAGDPLTSAEADLVLRRLRVFADDGSGTFDGSVDFEVARVASFDLVQGVLTVEFPKVAHGVGAGSLAVAHGTTQTLFVVLDLEDDAADHSLATLELSHGSELGDRAVDDTHSTPITQEFSAPVSTGPIALLDR